MFIRRNSTQTMICVVNVGVLTTADSLHTHIHIPYMLLSADHTLTQAVLGSTHKVLGLRDSVFLLDASSGKRPGSATQVRR